MSQTSKKWLLCCTFMICLTILIILSLAKPSTWIQRSLDGFQVGKYKLNNFTVEGKVINEGGDELPNVLISINETTNAFGGVKAAMENKRHLTVNGEFNISSQGYEVLNLGIHKTGFASQYRSFTKSGNYQQVVIILKPEDKP